MEVIHISDDPSFIAILWAVLFHRITADVVIGGTAILLFYYVKWRYSIKMLPTGPTPIPIFGNMRELDPVHPLGTLHQWVHKYGDIMTIHIYSKPVVVLSSFEAVNEVLVTKSYDFSGRPFMYRGLYCMNMVYDITCASFSPRWVMRKKIFMNGLKMYGERLQLLESISQNLLHEFCDSVEKTGNLGKEPFDPIVPVHDLVANIIASIIFARKIDPEQTKILTYMTREGFKMLSPIGNGPEIEVYPWLRFFGNTAFKKMVHMKEVLRKWFSNQFKLWEEGFDPENPRCVMDALMLNKEHERDAEGNPHFTDDEVKMIVFDMLMGGVTTTATAVYCLLAILATHQDVQKKLQNEVDKHVGSRMPCLADRNKLHLTEAAILEVLRKHRGTSLPHKTMVDTTVAGYKIPKDTEVWTNLWSLHNDENFWGDPWSFRPERFLDSEGKLVAIDHPNRRHLFNFGAGRRVCPGETLAKNRLFLIVATLVQRFSFQPAGGLTAADTDPRDFKISLSLSPLRYKIHAIPRF